MICSVLVEMEKSTVPFSSVVPLSSQSEAYFNLRCMRYTTGVPPSDDNGGFQVMKAESSLKCWALTSRGRPGFTSAFNTRQRISVFLFGIMDVILLFIQRVI